MLNLELVVSIVALIEVLFCAVQHRVAELYSA